MLVLRKYVMLWGNIPGTILMSFALRNRSISITLTPVHTPSSFLEFLEGNYCCTENKHIQLFLRMEIKGNVWTIAAFVSFLAFL